MSDYRDDLLVGAARTAAGSTQCSASTRASTPLHALPFAASTSRELPSITAFPPLSSSPTAPLHPFWLPSPAWRAACADLQLDDTGQLLQEALGASPTPIAELLHSSRGWRRGIDLMVVRLLAMPLGAAGDRTTGEPILVGAEDPSGRMLLALSEEVAGEFSASLGEGAVLLLRGVSSFTLGPSGARCIAVTSVKLIRVWGAG